MQEPAYANAHAMHMDPAIASRIGKCSTSSPHFSMETWLSVELLVGCLCVGKKLTIDFPRSIASFVPRALIHCESEDDEDTP